MDPLSVLDHIRKGIGSFIDVVERTMLEQTADEKEKKSHEKKYPKFEAASFMKLYNLVFTTATDLERERSSKFERERGNTRVLYELFEEIILGYLRSHTYAKLKKAYTGTPGQNSCISRLSIWARACVAFRHVVQGATSAFMYIDRYYTNSGEEGVVPLKQRAYELFQTAIFDDVQRQTCNMLLQAIRNDRADPDASHHSVVRSSVKPFLELGDATMKSSDSLHYYKKYLADRIVDDAEAFYKKRALEWSEHCNLSLYLIHVEKALAAEHQRISNYLVQDTKEKLLRRCYQELLAKHQPELLRKRYGLKHMLKEGCKADLSRLFQLYSMYPQDLSAIAEMFQHTVSDQGEDTIERHQRSPGIDRQNSIVEELIKLHQHYYGIVDECFQRSTPFQRALKRAFESFINTASISNFLAQYAHQKLLRCGNSSGRELEITLDQIVFLYTYVRDKDVFDQKYQILLQDRLLKKKCTSEHIEKVMISKLKAAAGYQWAKQLEGMFEDVALSKTLTREFKKCRGPPEVCRGPPEVSFTVCKYGQWPASSYTSSKIPPELKDVADNFRTFYIGRYRHREIQWRMDMGDAEVQVKFNPGKTVRLGVSTYQMCILLCFNHKKIISYGEILDATGLSDDVILQNHLLSLAHPKLKVLLKKPAGAVVYRNTKFMINTKFSCPLHKITVKILNIIKDHKKTEVDESVAIQRRCQMDACIVRIMKQRKDMKHVDLVREVTAQLQARFKPSPASIKKRIEHLIEQEYMKRDSNRRGAYEYLA